MVRWLRSALGAGLAASFVAACSAESNNGPPSAPCSDQVKGSAPVCGKVCANKCGCGDCQPGSQTFIDGVLYVCNGKCLSAASGSGGSSAGGGGNTGGGGAGGNTGGSAGAGDGG